MIWGVEARTERNTATRQAAQRQTATLSPMKTTPSKKELLALISEHESDYWQAVENNWGGYEEIAETIVRLRELTK